MIRLYGVEVKPFILPLLLTLRIFTLEYARKMFNVDELHYHPKHQNIYFSFPFKFWFYVLNNLKVSDLVKGFKDPMVLRNMTHGDMIIISFYIKWNLGWFEMLVIPFGSPTPLVHQIILNDIFCPNMGC